MEEGHRFDADSAQNAKCGWTEAQVPLQKPAWEIHPDWRIAKQTEESVDALVLIESASESRPVAAGFSRLTTPVRVAPASMLGDTEAPNCNPPSRICESDAVENGDTTHANFHYGSYIGALCAPSHIECEPDPEFSMFEAIDRGDYLEAARVYEATKAFVIINQDRGMVQLLTCSGASVAYQRRVEIPRLTRALEVLLRERASVKPGLAELLLRG